MLKCCVCGDVSETSRPVVPGGGTSCDTFRDKHEYWNAEMCRYCCQWFDELDFNFEHGACRFCAMDQLDAKKGLAFLESDDDLPREFFVEYYFESKCEEASNELIDLCRNEWLVSVELGLNGIDSLRLFIKKWYLSEYMAWLEKEDKTEFSENGGEIIA